MIQDSTNPNLSQPNEPVAAELVLAEARKFLPDCNYVCNLFDLTFVWVDDKALEITGYTQEDAKNLKNIDIFDESYTEQKYRQDTIEHIAQTTGETDYLVKHKSGGSMKFHVQYHVFEFNNGWYITGKVLKFEYLEESKE